MPIGGDVGEKSKGNREETWTEFLFTYGGIYGRKEIEGFFNNKVSIQHKWLHFARTRSCNTNWLSLVGMKPLTQINGVLSY
jgi:hypothetical protein